jgi:aryl-alcohol dehydrogenase-like predicted oxidoreductase
MSTTDILATCREIGIAVIAYSPVGRGVLTGQIESFSDIPEDDTKGLYSTWYAAMGWTAWARRRVAAEHSDSPRCLIYSPFALDIESSTTDILATCRELGIAVIAYSPVDRGIL